MQRHAINILHGNSAYSDTEETAEEVDSDDEQLLDIDDQNDDDEFQGLVDNEGSCDVRRHFIWK